MQVGERFQITVPFKLKLAASLPASVNALHKAAGRYLPFNLLIFNFVIKFRYGSINPPNYLKIIRASTFSPLQIRWIVSKEIFFRPDSHI